MKLQELKTNIDSIMKTLHTGNITNPIEAVEQITYFIFLKLLWENENTLGNISTNYKKIFDKDNKKISWGSLITLTGSELFTRARDSLENLSKLPNMNASGKMLFRGSTLKIFSPSILRTVIQKIDKMNFSNSEADPKGDIYEYLIGKIKVSGLNGQFRTPRNIIDMMVKIIDPKPGETICDPACGTAGFLVSSYKHILKQNTPKDDLKKNFVTGSNLNNEQWNFLEKDTFNGFDSDSTMSKISLMNLYMHGLQKSNLKYHDPLTSNLHNKYAKKKYDIILANPPFTGTVATENILSDLNYQLNTSATELLFIKFILDHLNDGGRAGIIVPNGVVFSDDEASIKIRKKIIEENNLKMVLQLPYRIFEPYTPTGTNILFLEKRGKTDKVLYYEMENDGYSLNKKREPIKENDIPDIVESYLSKKDKKHVSNAFYKSFSVKHQTLVENNYFLAIGRYKKIFPQLRNLDNPKKYYNDLISKTDKYLKNN
jgi:type I restriction enzyme M protein